MFESRKEEEMEIKGCIFFCYEPIFQREEVII